MNGAHSCPALLICAPASGQGKTTITAALARQCRNRGGRVRVFKTGPDFLDPMILQQASGNPVYQLDLFMVGLAECRHMLHQAAGDADLILIEGVMGLFDGAPSSADLAVAFGVPVLGVIDGSAMAQTFGALAQGLAGYRDDLPFAGVLANRVGSARHGEMLAESLPKGMRFFGALPREEAFSLPERHLGLVQGAEIADLDARMNAAAAALDQAGIFAQPDAVIFAPEKIPAPPMLLRGKRIAVARDAAFAFLYAANLDLLRAMGAELVFFSPLRDKGFVAADALYLPGGYPELHLQSLLENTEMTEAIRTHHMSEKPMLAECGGMLYMLQSLAGLDGAPVAMAGLLSGHGVMQKRLTALSLQSVTLPEGELRGHTFHYSQLQTDMTPLAHGRSTRGGGADGEAVYRLGRLTASYIHLYFPSNPEAAAKLFLP